MRVSTEHLSVSGRAPARSGRASRWHADVPARPVLLVFAIVFGGTLAAALAS